MGNLKNRITRLARDVFSIETAILIEEEDGRTCRAYSRLSFEGDSINYLDKEISKDEVSMHTSVVDTAVHSRYALIRILDEALD